MKGSEKSIFSKIMDASYVAVRLDFAVKFSEKRTTGLFEELLMTLSDESDKEIEPLLVAVTEQLRVDQQSNPKPRQSRGVKSLIAGVVTTVSEGVGPLLGDDVAQPWTND